MEEKSCLPWVDLTPLHRGRQRELAANPVKYIFKMDIGIKKIGRNN